MLESSAPDALGLHHKNKSHKLIREYKIHETTKQLHIDRRNISSAEYNKKVKTNMNKVNKFSLRFRNVEYFDDNRNVEDHRNRFRLDKQPKVDYVHTLKQRRMERRTKKLNIVSSALPELNEEYMFAKISTQRTKRSEAIDSEFVLRNEGNLLSQRKDDKKKKKASLSSIRTEIIDVYMFKENNESLRKLHEGPTEPPSLALLSHINDADVINKSIRHKRDVDRSSKEDTADDIWEQNNINQAHTERGSINKTIIEGVTDQISSSVIPLDIIETATVTDDSSGESDYYFESHSINDTEKISNESNKNIMYKTNSLPMPNFEKMTEDNFENKVTATTIQWSENTKSNFKKNNESLDIVMISNTTHLNDSHATNVSKTLLRSSMLVQSVRFEEDLNDIPYFYEEIEENQTQFIVDEVLNSTGKSTTEPNIILSIFQPEEKEQQNHVLYIYIYG